MFDLDRAWTLHPQVALRPEAFGALAYNFGTRRLSFLKSPALVDVVATLDAHPRARDACRAAGVGDEELPDFEHALATLARTGMIAARETDR
jgi:putative mycofactocin binding protein MftB